MSALLLRRRKAALLIRLYRSVVQYQSFCLLDCCKSKVIVAPRSVGVQPLAADEIFCLAKSTSDNLLHSKNPPTPEHTTSEAKIAHDLHSATFDILSLGIQVFVEITGE